MRGSGHLPERMGTIGVESLDAAYRAGFQAEDESPHALDCELVEDGGAFEPHRSEASARGARYGRPTGTSLATANWC